MASAFVFLSKISSWAFGIWFAIQAIDFQGMRLTRPAIA